MFFCSQSHLLSVMDNTEISLVAIAGEIALGEIDVGPILVRASGAALAL